MENSRIKNYFAVTDFFFSMYDLSNVGNPLLEAIRMNKIIFTLDNGDTTNWIKNEENGFIFPVDNKTLYGCCREAIRTLFEPAEKR